MGTRMCVKAGNHLLVTRGEVDLQLAPQILDYIHRTFDEGGPIRLCRQQRCIAKVFRANTKRKVASRSFSGQVFEKRWDLYMPHTLQHNGSVFALTHHLSSLEEVHGRRANKACHKKVGRMIVEFLWGPKLLHN